MPCPPMRFLFITLTLIACTKQPPEPPPREPIGILYAVNELPIHGKPKETARVINTYHSGEAVTVLSTQGDWVEIRLGSGDSGWVRKEHLTAQKNSGDFSSASAPRFRTPPNPVYSHQKIDGEIVFEASVNTSGDIVAIRTLVNTTGSKALEAENRASLQQAKFYPMKVRGAVQPFVYEFRVEY